MNEFDYTHIEEECYRRGFHQGFSAARKRPDISEMDVKKWRSSDC